jgi:leucyl-tRNA synthetase
VPAVELTDEAALWQLVLEREKIKKYAPKEKIIKKIYVAGKILNLVVSA